MPNQGMDERVEFCGAIISHIQFLGGCKNEPYKKCTSDSIISTFIAVLFETWKVNNIVYEGK